jgi:hypothetical protein
MSQNLLSYVEDFNRGDVDTLLGIFGSMGTIIKVFQKRDMLKLINPFNINLEDYQLELLDAMLNGLNDKEMMKKTISLLSDVAIKEDGYYLKLSDRTDLCKLFNDSGGRNFSTRDVVEYALDDEMREHFSNTTDDIYDDVIEVLTPENIELLKTHILDTLTNWKIEVEEMQSPDLFVEYADDEGIFYITPENVGDVIGDKESFMYLLDEDYLPNVTGDLHSIHYNAYNQAYESEVYEITMNELETFFDTKSNKWVSEPSKRNPEQLTEYYYLKFNPNEIQNSIKKYVGNRERWGSYDTVIDTTIDWMGIMDMLMEDSDENWLNFRIPEYPDSRLVDKYINELFTDYI